MEIGGLDVLGGSTVNTDVNGNFTISGVVVPSLDPGIHAVMVEVGTGSNRIISSTSFEVLIICSPPISSNWIIAETCTFEGTASAPANVIVEENIALTIAENASLDIDFTNFHLLIRSGAKVVIKDGGKIH